MRLLESPVASGSANASEKIGRQIKTLCARRQQIVAERAALYSSALKNGGGETPPVVDADERAAHEHAKVLLNGSAPAALSLPSELTRDKALYREQRGIDIALNFLTRADQLARATEAVAWAEAVRPQWQAVCREIVLTAVKLSNLELDAREMLEQCIDPTAVYLPMVNIIGSRSISEMPLGDLVEAALAQSIVTPAEVRKAQNVG